MKKNKKILIVDFNGSSPTYTYNFSLSFLKKGYDVKILGRENKKDLRIYKQKISYIGVDLKIKILNYILNWFYLLLIARKFQIIHIQWLSIINYSNFEVILIKALKILNPNLYYTVHNLYPHNQPYDKIIKTYNKVYILFDNLVVHTPSLEKILLDIAPNNNIIVIQHGLFYSNFSNNKKEKNYNMIMLGMIYRYKGIEDAIDAMKILKDQGNNYKFLIEGQGDQKYILFLQQKIKNLGLEKEVSIKKGYVDMVRLIKLYNMSFVTLMPYRNIEQSGVAYTSLGLEVPVVAYKVGELNKIIKDKQNGRLVEKNDINGFAESINWVFKNQNQLKMNLNQNKNNNLWSNSADILIKHYFSNDI